MTPRSSTVLRFALAINFAFSLTCGIVSAAFGSAIAGAIGALPVWPITGLGVGLMVFAAGIGWTLLRFRIGWALLVSALDLLWVLATLPLLLVPDLLTPLGAAVVLAIAAIVGGLGVLQLAGVRRMLRAETTDEGTYRHCIRLRSRADAGKLWGVVRALSTIARYSAGLSASRLEGGDVAVGAVRVCTNTRRQSWAEEVVELDDTARRLVLRFRSEAEDFPFPLAALTGGWTVTPGASGGAVVDIWWTATTHQRRLGWLIVALMTIPLDHDLPQIVGAMEADAMGEQVPVRPRPLALGYC